MNRTSRNEEPFAREIRRQASRASQEQHLTFWRGLGWIGSVGWMVVIPTLIGAFLGRWLDLQAGSGVFWTLSLLFAGLAAGCFGAWRHVTEELHN
jgi:ATP synthase protein I